MKYVIDIDGTICRCPSGTTDYRLSEPLTSRIETVNDLYDAGHKIVYLTARGMGRHNDDQFAARSEFYQMTWDQLTSWGAKFHGLVLGKPSGDVYVDDKAVTDTEFFERRIN